LCYPSGGTFRKSAIGGCLITRSAIGSWMTGNLNNDFYGSK
jgi:hypothetical protein